MLKVLVTGAAGFIGSHLIKSLLLESSYFIYALVREKHSSFSENTFLKYIYSDLSSVDFADSLPDNIDIVIHLAQSPNYRQFPEKSDDIFAVNIQSTYKLLEWSRKSGVKRFLFASSGNVYRTSNKPLSEDDICEPAGFYGKTKYIGELLVNSYSTFFEVSILRIFGVYGPGQKGMTVSNIIEKVKNRQDVTIAANIGLQFTPLFVDDCVALIGLLIHNPFLKPIYNLSGNEQLDLRELAEKVGALLSIHPTLVVIDGNPMYMNGDSHLIVNSLGYTYKFNIDSGLQKTLFP
jgi:UDP-glucose 4-epimerase